MALATGVAPDIRAQLDEQLLERNRIAGLGSRKRDAFDLHGATGR